MNDSLSILPMEFQGGGSPALECPDSEALCNREFERVHRSIKEDPFSPFNPRIDSKLFDSDQLSNVTQKITRISSPKILSSPEKPHAQPFHFSFSSNKPYSEVIKEGNIFLNNIINSLEDQPYEMSDPEEEKPIEVMEFDLYSSQFNGKHIPSWAVGDNLIQTMKDKIHPMDITFSKIYLEE